MGRAPRMLSQGLVGASALALGLGLVFPIAATIFNPFLAYGIVVVSWPAWALGAVAGGIAGVRQRSARASGSASSFPLGWVLCGVNVLAALATLAFPFHVS